MTKVFPLFDTREKLEADAKALQERIWKAGHDHDGISLHHLCELLDRQAAITEMEIKDSNLKNWQAWCSNLGIPCTTESVGELIFEQQAKVNELQAKVDELIEMRGELCTHATEYAGKAVRFEQSLADVEKTHMRLPVDEDGVPIRPGDVMCYSQDGLKMHVYGVCEKGIFYAFEGEKVQEPLPADVLHHFQPSLRALEL